MEKTLRYTKMGGPFSYLFSLIYFTLNSTLQSLTLCFFDFAITLGLKNISLGFWARAQKNIHRKICLKLKTEPEIFASLRVTISQSVQKEYNCHTHTHKNTPPHKKWK